MRLSGQFIHLFFFKDILHTKKHRSFCSNILICLESIIKHTSNFYLDITPKKHNKAHKQLSFRHYAQKHKKKKTFRLNIFIRIIKHTSNFHSDITPRSIKNKQLFLQRQLVQDVMNNFSLRYMLKKRQLVQDVINNFRLDIFILRCSAYK